MAQGGSGIVDGGAFASVSGMFASMRLSLEAVGAQAVAEVVVLPASRERFLFLDDADRVLTAGRRFKARPVGYAQLT